MIAEVSAVTVRGTRALLPTRKRHVEEQRKPWSEQESGSGYLPGSEGEHILQEQLGTSPRAKQFYDKQVADYLTPVMTEFIGRMEMAFVATSDPAGECDCSFRAGAPGFVRVIDDKTIAYPELRGNGVMASMGNMLRNPHIGIFFVDFSRDLIGLHVNGDARIVPPAHMLEFNIEIDEAENAGKKPVQWVLIHVTEAYIHCSKHIPLLVPQSRVRHWGTDNPRHKGGDYFGVTAIKAEAGLIEPRRRGATAAANGAVSHSADAPAVPAAKANGSAQVPAVNGSASRRGIDGSAAVPVANGSASHHANGSSAAVRAVNGSVAVPAVNGSVSHPGKDGSAPVQAVNGSVSPPAEDGSAPVHAVNGSDSHSGKNGSAPGQAVKGSVPHLVLNVSDLTPVASGSARVPALNGSAAAPAVRDSAFLSAPTVSSVSVPQPNGAEQSPAVNSSVPPAAYGSAFLSAPTPADSAPMSHANGAGSHAKVNGSARPHADEVSDPLPTARGPATVLQARRPGLRPQCNGSASLPRASGSSAPPTANGSRLPD
jgi:uncharacterized protein